MRRTSFALLLVLSVLTPASGSLAAQGVGEHPAVVMGGLPFALTLAGAPDESSWFEVRTADGTLLRSGAVEANQSLAVPDLVVESRADLPLEVRVGEATEVVRAPLRARVVLHRAAAGGDPARADLPRGAGRAVRGGLAGRAGVHGVQPAAGHLEHGRHLHRAGAGRRLGADADRGVLPAAGRDGRHHRPQRRHAGHRGGRVAGRHHARAGASSPPGSRG